MFLKLDLNDIKLIGFYIGKILIAIGLLMLIPLFIALIFKEGNPALDFSITILLYISIGFLFTYFCYSEKEIQWKHAMILVSLIWLISAVLSAIPLYLSQHFGSFLDACFETISGYTTSGLSLVQDLDHLAYSYNFWRHFIMFLGGQGIIIIALTILTTQTEGTFKIYVGEAREEKIFPNVVQTAKFIWIVSIVYFFIGSLILWFVGIKQTGLSSKSALFHAVCLFMAGFDTGGFTPQSQNILYYHSFTLELVIFVIMILGSINFALHHAIWTGNRKEIYKNIEPQTFLVTLSFAFIITLFGLLKPFTYSSLISLFRKSFFHILSSHTGTGYMTIYAQQFPAEWSNLSLFGIIFAMAIGGSACSTTGGIKLLRIGIIFKTLIYEIYKLLSPPSSIIIQKIHHIKEIILEDKVVKTVILITLLYISTCLLGTVVTMFYGYPFLNSLFESVSATNNVGLSCGITSPTMPVLLKITYIFEMWAGRLEFLSVLVLIGFIMVMIKGKR